MRILGATDHRSRLLVWELSHGTDATTRRHPSGARNEQAVDPFPLSVRTASRTGYLWALKDLHEENCTLTLGRTGPPYLISALAVALEVGRRGDTRSPVY